MAEAAKRVLLPLSVEVHPDYSGAWILVMASMAAELWPTSRKGVVEGVLLKLQS
jgi:hypothetical protein